MSITPGTAKHDLMVQIEAALQSGSSSEAIVELIVRSGWQPRPIPDPNSDYLDGVLRDGTHVPIEIRHALVSHAR